MDPGSEDPATSVYRTQPNLDPNAGPSTLKKIFAGKLFDPYTLQLVPKQLITVSTKSGLIVDVQPYDSSLERALGLEIDRESTANDEDRADVVDLRECTVMPGFVDVHVHRE